MSQPPPDPYAPPDESHCRSRPSPPQPLVFLMLAVLPAAAITLAAADVPGDTTARFGIGVAVGMLVGIAIFALTYRAMLAHRYKRSATQSAIPPLGLFVALLLDHSTNPNLILLGGLVLGGLAAFLWCGLLASWRMARSPRPADAE